MHERENLNLQRDPRMRATIYLATACGVAVIQGCDESWVGEVCLNDKLIQCVAADRTRKGVVYCGTFGNGMLRSSDRGATWHPLQNFTGPNVMALASSQSGALYAGTELSAMYRSEDGGESWCELETLLTLPSAKSWSFPPRPETHHVQFILPHLAHPARLHAAIEAGALVYSDDAGSTWRDRVSSAPRDTHCLAVHPLAPTRLHSAAGDGYFESVDGGNSWRRAVDGLEHQYCWSIAISLADAKTLLLSTSKSAYGAHYKESANSILYRRTGSDAWKPVRKGLPDPQGLRIPVVAASSSEPGLFYCSTEGMVYRSEDDGLQWQKLAVQWNTKATAEHATGMAIVEEG
jgi:photosystem II stability/assembly factor-like uncharacterized protein